MTKRTQIADPLTNRQRDIRDWVKNEILTNGYGPSIREIGEHFGITSPNGMLSHIKALARKGAMMPAKKDGRSIARAYVFPKDDQ